MRIIIIEGIATSGKTSVIKELATILDKQKTSFIVIDEKETLMPLLDNKDKRKSIKFLKQVIKKAKGQKREFVIFDRLFFTHIFRTKSSTDDFQEIENSIKKDAALILLTIAEAKIQERINYARKHRDKGWNNYVDKLGNGEEVNGYYISQQRLLLKLFENSLLDRLIFDTSNIDFKKIADDIVIHCNNT